MRLSAVLVFGPSASAVPWSGKSPHGARFSYNPVWTQLDRIVHYFSLITPSDEPRLTNRSRAESGRRHRPARSRLGDVAPPSTVLTKNKDLHILMNKTP
ncbi:hypothetical protein F2P81_019875 [Scophthalmus maximus]|uniref:Uncharacterized protein n=1 Tax=Scophthalmus maximus TaxID=52904 RepID=A0A6A4S904_SCOMX|nr:hypothetical protein F2P81_019875 [Scophthalmus maximus]